MGYIMKLARVAKIYFHFTAKPNGLNPIGWLRGVNRRHCLKKLKEQHELFALIKQAQQQSSSTGSDYSDYWTLYSHIRQRKPLDLLECGSGISTIVIAYALKENFEETGVKAHFISLEENEFYFNQICSLMPAVVKDFAKLELKPRQEKLYDGHLGSYYENIENREFDFMYIDGPTDRKIWNDPTSPKCLNANVLNVRKAKKFSAILDQRVWTLERLRILLKGYRLSYNVIKKVTIITPIAGKEPK